MKNYFGNKNFSTFFNFFLLIIVLSIWSYIIISFLYSDSADDNASLTQKTALGYPQGLESIGKNWVSRAAFLDSVINADSLTSLAGHSEFDPFFHMHDFSVEVLHTPPPVVYIDTYNFRLLGLVQDSSSVTAFFQVHHFIIPQTDSNNPTGKRSPVDSFLLQLSTLFQKNSRSAKKVPDHIISLNDSTISIRFKSVTYNVPYSMK